MSCSRVLCWVVRGKNHGTERNTRTYPKQIGIDPLPMSWGAADAQERGPVVVSRASSTLGRRNGEYLVPGGQGSFAD